MAITTLDGYVGSVKRQTQFWKTASLTTVAGGFGRAFAQAGMPAAGTLSAGNTANGVVPTNATTGYIGMPSSFTNTGYISRVNVNSSVASSITFVDVLFAAGAYAYNASTTLASQPSYSSRIPNSDYRGTQIWVEAVTAFTGNLSIAITYTNQDGATGHTTGTFATGIAPILGRMIQIPLAAGDTGVQKIESVTATVSSAGTFNVLVVRPLFTVSIPVAYYGQDYDFLRTGLPQVYATSALGAIIQTVSTSTGLPSCLIELADG